MKKLKVSVVIGTRPNLIKISPLAKRLAKDPDIELQLLDTGQHYDYELDEIFVKELGIPRPVFLEVGSKSRDEQIETAVAKIGKELASFKPDVVLVIGDTNSTLAGARAAKKAGILLGHIEAGLRSFDKTMPEEVNRIEVDGISDMLFAPTETAVKNLRDEKVSEGKVFFTGDISVDACLGNYEAARKSGVLEENGIPADFVLVTLHRASNVDDREMITGIMEALEEVAKSKTVVFPIHPRTRKRLEEFGIYDKYAKSIKFIKPQGYFEFLKLLGSAACVVTDSGGVQKEAMILKTPCITVRDTTEWPETLESGANVLVAPSGILAEVLKRSTRDFRMGMKIGNPFGDGKTSERIIGILKGRKPESARSGPVSLKDKTLLVLSWFPDKDEKSNVGIFVREQIELVKDKFKRVVVIDAIPYVPGFLLPLLPKNLQLLESKRDYSYDNVSVYFPRFLDLRKFPLAKKSVSESFRLEAIEKAIKGNGITFDIIHANFVYPNGYLGALLKEKFKKPLIVTAHGSTFRDYAKGASKFAEQIKKALAAAEVITTPHPELFGYLGCMEARKKAVLIEKMPGFEKTDKKADLGADKSTSVVTFLAMLEESKDPLTFVRSIPLVLKERKDVLFAIAGDGSLMTDVKKEVAKLGVEKHVRILGLRPDRQEILNASDIFCALSPVENIWSGTVQEAMYCGVPMILTKVGGTGMQFEHKKTAYLIPPNSPKDLAGGILELLENDELRLKLGKNARGVFVSKWDRNRIRDAWIGEYERAGLQSPQT